MVAARAAHNQTQDSALQQSGQLVRSVQILTTSWSVPSNEAGPTGQTNCTVLVMLHTSQLDLATRYQTLLLRWAAETCKNKTAATLCTPQISKDCCCCCVCAATVRLRASATSGGTLCLSCIARASANSTDSLASCCAAACSPDCASCLTCCSSAAVAAGLLLLLAAVASLPMSLRICWSASVGPWRERDKGQHPGRWHNCEHRRQHRQS